MEQHSNQYHGEWERVPEMAALTIATSTTTPSVFATSQASKGSYSEEHKEKVVSEEKRDSEGIEKV